MDISPQITKVYTIEIPLHIAYFSKNNFYFCSFFLRFLFVKNMIRFLSQRTTRVALGLCRPLSSTQELTPEEKFLDDIFNMRSAGMSSLNLEKELLIYSNKKQTPVSLRALMETAMGENLGKFDEMMKGKYSQSPVPKASQRILIQVACFLHSELPVRLAHRAIRLEGHPLFLRSGNFISYLFF